MSHYIVTRGQYWFYVVLHTASFRNILNISKQNAILYVLSYLLNIKTKVTCARLLHGMLFLSITS